MKLEVGDGVQFKNFFGAEGEPTYHIVTAIYPEGIPSCRGPMVKLEGLAGVVLESHCVLLERGAANLEIESKEPDHE